MKEQLHTTQESHLFDEIAESYYNLTPNIPEQYIQLLVKTFTISPDDTIVDLGCGSGELACALRRHAGSVVGIDESETMVAMAEKRDQEKQVRWIHGSVADMDLGEEQYNLITAFESFHLFPDKKELIQRCAKALKPGGALCVGWVMYSFDPPLRTPIEEIFAAHDMPWEDWGAWTCPTFPEMVIDAKAGLSVPKKETIGVAARVSTRDILDYNFNVSKTASLDPALKQHIAHALWERISDIYPTGESVGYDQYSIMYATKE